MISHEQALQAVEQQELVAVLMFPLIFGGEDSERNTMYVPVEVANLHNQYIASIARLVEQGLVDTMRVSPEYKGDSCVPAKLHIQTSLQGGAGPFNPSIDIW